MNRQAVKIVRFGEAYNGKKMSKFRYATYAKMYGMSDKLVLRMLRDNHPRMPARALKKLWLKFKSNL